MTHIQSVVAYGRFWNLVSGGIVLLWRDKMCWFWFFVSSHTSRGSMIDTTETGHLSPPKSFNMLLLVQCTFYFGKQKVQQKNTSQTWGLGVYLLPSSGRAYNYSAFRWSWLAGIDGWKQRSFSDQLSELYNLFLTAGIWHSGCEHRSTVSCSMRHSPSPKSKRKDTVRYERLWLLFILLILLQWRHGQSQQQVGNSSKREKKKELPSSSGQQLRHPCNMTCPPGERGGWKQTILVQNSRSIPTKEDDSVENLCEVETNRPNGSDALLVSSKWLCLHHSTRERFYRDRRVHWTANA